MNLKKKIVEYYSFYCPGCKYEHTYLVDGTQLGYEFNGNMESPTFYPSLLNEMPKVTKDIVDGKIVESIKMVNRCHLFLTEGEIRYLTDCNHEFAGKTIKLKDIKHE